MSQKETVQQNISTIKKAFHENYEHLEKGLPQFMNELRKPAFEIFEKQGLPTKKDEEYKYTDINGTYSDKLKMHFGPKNIVFNMADAFKCDVPDLDTNTIVLLNGFFLDREPLRKLASGAIIGSLAAAANKYPDLVEKYYGKLSGNSTDSLAALNTAFAQDGIFIYVPKSAQVEKPIQIVNIAMSDEDQFIQHRNLFILEESAEFKLVICDHTLSESKFLTNALTEIFVAENAKLDIVKMQNEHNEASQLSSTFINQERSSHVSNNTISLHGGFIRNNSVVDLNGEGAETYSLGLYLADDTQHIDNFVNINHNEANCTSTQLFKGVLDNRATGAFNGKIYVKEDAQKTEAYQSNNSILLTNDAKMNTKPQLEIYADDVKCSHGATIGQLDMDAFFYLRSRGIGEQEARMLLMFGFAHDVIGEIKVEPLRVRVDELIEKRLRGELSRCNSCTMHCN